MKLNIDAGKQIAFYVVALLAFVAAGIFVWPFVPAILWATVFGIMLYPLYQKLRARGVKQTPAALIVTMIPTLLLVIPAIVLASVAGVQVASYVTDLMHNSSSTEAGSDVFGYIGNEINDVLTPLAERIGVQNVDFAELLQNNQEAILNGLSGPLAVGLQSLLVTIVTLAISILATFFMVRDSHYMVAPLTDLVPLPKSETEKILAKLSATVRSVFTSIFLTALIQGGLCGIAYAVAGVPGWITWTVITTIACAIPLVGAPVVYVPVGVSLIIQGKTVEGIAILAFGFIVVSNIDQFLRSHFIGSGTKIHPMAILISLLGGVLVLGPVGVMAGPMLLTLLLAIVDVMRTQHQLDRNDDVLAACAEGETPPDGPAAQPT